MPVVAFSANATSTSVDVNIVPNKSGILWVIPQFSVQTIPVRLNASVTVTMNGQYVTSAANLPVSASGPPALVLQYFDTLTFTFNGVQAGDNVIVTLMYNEAPWGYFPRSDVV